MTQTRTAPSIFTELSSGLSVLCSGLSVLGRGNLVDGAEAAFKFYDCNGDGVILMDEMR